VVCNTIRDERTKEGPSWEKDWKTEMMASPKFAFGFMPSVYRSLVGTCVIGEKTPYGSGNYSWHSVKT